VLAPQIPESEYKFAGSMFPLPPPHSPPSHLLVSPSVLSRSSLGPPSVLPGSSLGPDTLVLPQSWSSLLPPPSAFPRFSLGPDTFGPPSVLVLPPPSSLLPQPSLGSPSVLPRFLLVLPRLSFSSPPPDQRQNLTTRRGSNFGATQRRQRVQKQQMQAREGGTSTGWKKHNIHGSLVSR
jgi:hypothetical protein